MMDQSSYGYVNWANTAVYDRVSKEIAGWPKYKKEAYNELFGYSKHASRLEIVN